MPLHVRIMPEIVGGSCSSCGGTPPTPSLIALNVFAEGGRDQTSPVCLSCFATRTPDLLALIEPPDTSPGRRPPSRRVRKRTDKEERELAELSGGKRQKGSGSLPHLKGDFYRKGVYRGESKTCFGKSPSWDLDHLTKIRSEAAFGEVPVLVTTFMDRSTHQVLERWVTIPFENWQEKYAPRDDQ